MTTPENNTTATALTRVVDITLLTQDDCGLCEQARQVLHRVGEDYRLRITEIDLASEPGQKMATHAGMMFAPGVLINGQPFSFGRLSERKLRRALDQGRHTRADGRAGPR